jgi:hypothetical protein
MFDPCITHQQRHLMATSGAFFFGLMPEGVCSVCRSWLVAVDGLPGAESEGAAGPVPLKKAAPFNPFSKADLDGFLISHPSPLTPS